MSQTKMLIMTRKRRDDPSAVLVFLPRAGVHFRLPPNPGQTLPSRQEARRFQTLESPRHLPPNGPVLACRTGGGHRGFSSIPTCQHTPIHVCAVSCQWKRLLVSLGQVAIVQCPAVCSFQQRLHHDRDLLNLPNSCSENSSKRSHHIHEALSNYLPLRPPERQNFPCFAS